MAVSYGGQRNWQPRGAATNEFIVEVGFEKKIFYQAELRTIFGRLNQFRTLDITKGERDGEMVELSGGGETSPVWEKTFGEENRDCRFTYEEPLFGPRTFGQKDVGPGNFTAYKHEEIFAVQIDTPTFPLLDRESQLRQSGMIPMARVKPDKKNAIRIYKEKWTEIDAFCAITDGASQPMLDTTNGGLGGSVSYALPGASAGQNRSLWNTVVCNATLGFTTPNFTRATHEGTLSTAVAALTNAAADGFNYETHKWVSAMLPTLRFPGIKIGNSEYRAACLIDPWLIQRMAKDAGSLSDLYVYATPRSMKNPALDGMQTIELDNILYIPSEYWKYFRPTANGSTMVYLPSGADPFDPSFTNTSNICMAYYFTAGALLRGRSTKVWFTASGEGEPDGGHKKGTTLAMHWDDSWKRTEWTTKDGRSVIANDRSLMLYAYDPGPGVSYAA